MPFARIRRGSYPTLQVSDVHDRQRTTSFDLVSEHPEKTTAVYSPLLPTVKYSHEPKISGKTRLGCTFQSKSFETRHRLKINR